MFGLSVWYDRKDGFISVGRIGGWVLSMRVPGIRLYRNRRR